MVSVCRGPSSVPTGVFALAARRAVAMSSSVRPRAASASGRARTRTAKRFWPLMFTCATPGSVESVGEMRFSAKLFSSDSGIEGEVSVTKRIGRVGRVHLAVGRRRGHLDGKRALRAQQRRLHVHRGLVDVAVLVELERDLRVAERRGRGDHVHARDRGELLLERRRDRRGHVLRARAGQVRRSPRWSACRTAAAPRSGCRRRR